MTLVKRGKCYSVEISAYPVEFEVIPVPLGSRRPEEVRARADREDERPTPLRSLIRRLKGCRLRWRG